MSHYRPVRSNRRLRARRAMLGILAISGLVAAGCAGGGGSEPSDNTVTFALTEEPDTLDPHKSDTAASGEILDYAGDSLITKSPDGKFVADLAKSWKPSSGGRVWTFTLKKGIKFQNGDPVDAKAVAASFERATNPDIARGTALSLFSNIAKVKPLSSTKVQMTLKNPSSVFLDHIAGERGAIVDVTVAKKQGDDFGRAPVLTGPWQVKQWRSGDKVVLTKNKDYAWGPSFVHAGPPHIAKLVFKVMPEASAQTAALQSGAVDVLTSVPTAHAEDFAKDKENYTTYTYLRNGVGLYIAFNVKKAPFDDRSVRLALNHAIAKKPLIDVALEGRGQPACGPLPPTIRGYWKGICDYGPQHSSEKALSLLHDAGWQQSGKSLTRDGKKFEFTLCTTDIQSWSQSAQLVQQQLKQLGITMHIQNYEFATLLSKAEGGKCAATFMGYTYTNPDILHLLFDSSQIGTGLNLNHYSSKKLDTLLTKSRRTTNKAEEQQILRRIQQYVVDQALWVPLWNERHYTSTVKALKGATMTNEGVLLLMDARIR